MQTMLREINSASQKFTQYDHGNLIAQQHPDQKMKPFVALKLLSASSSARINQLTAMPSSGQAIITYIISGQALYSDSTGKHGTLMQDDWSWVISGTGVVSRLEPITSDYLAIQLCIALTPAMETSVPQSAYINSEPMERESPAQVLIGWHRHQSGVFTLPSLMNYLVVHLHSDQSWNYEVPINHRLVWVLVVRGSLVTPEGEIKANRITMLSATREKIKLRATADAIFVVGSCQEFMYDLICTKNSVHTSHEALHLGLQKLAELEHTLA